MRKLHLGIVIALVATTLVSTIAHAQTGAAAGLLKRYGNLDRTCRGGSGNAACCARTKVGVRLNGLGWCYGKRGQTTAEMRWHHCARASDRFDPKDYCQ